MIAFEWDADKALSNFRKHGVSFAQAQSAFCDRDAVEWIDNGLDNEEVRVVLVGLARSVLLVIVFTERDESIRIISARRATKHEQRLYTKENRHRTL